MRCGIIEVEGGSANDNGHNICECDNGDGNINHGNVTIKDHAGCNQTKRMPLKSSILGLGRGGAWSMPQREGAKAVAGHRSKQRCSVAQGIASTAKIAVYGTRELRGDNELLQDEANKSFRFTSLQNQLGLSNIFLSLNLMNHARLSVSAREAKHMQRRVTRQVNVALMIQRSSRRIFKQAGAGNGMRRAHEKHSLAASLLLPCFLVVCNDGVEEECPMSSHAQQGTHLPFGQSDTGNQFKSFGACIFRVL